MFTSNGDDLDGAEGAGSAGDIVHEGVLEGALARHGGLFEGA